MLNSQPLEVFDGGLQTRCLTYVDDAVQATFLVATTDLLEHSVYNVGSEKENTISEIVAMVRKFDEKSSIKFIDTVEAYGNSYEDLLRRVPSAQRIAGELDWSATISAEEGIKKFFEWASKSSWWRTYG
jgi:UDP-glucose 4-epimerase